VHPQGAFGVRQLAAAFENGPIGPFFKRPLESGSRLPKGFACKNYAALGGTPALPGISIVGQPLQPEPA